MTKDVRVAVSFGTMGVPMKLRSVLVDKTGERITRFYMALRDLDGKYVTGKIKANFESGKLEKTTPNHPFLTIMRAQHNRMMMVNLIMKGTRCRLVETAAKGIWQYVAGDEGLPGIAGQKEVFSTMDVKMVAALGLVGLPLLAIEGGEGNRKFFLPRFGMGPMRADGLPRVDAADFATAWRTNKEDIPWEEPFAQGMRGLYNRERFLDAINKDVELVMLRKPKSVRAAMMRSDSSLKAWDEMKRFFDK